MSYTMDKPELSEAELANELIAASPFCGTRSSGCGLSTES